MGFTVCFVKAEQAAATRCAAMRGLQRDPFRAYAWAEFTLPGAVVAVRRSPELSLCYQGSGADGQAGTVLVAGYVVFERAGREAAELASALLAAWQRSDTEFLGRLEGSFALFMHDPVRQRCLLATDSMNTRPIWLHQDSMSTIAGTDLRNVVRLLPKRPDLDKAGCWSFLHRRCAIGDRSLFEGVRALEAGEAAQFADGLLRSRSLYAEPIIRPDYQRSMRDTAAELVNALSLTCREACAGSHSPSLFLSGGLDSRLIAGICPTNVTAVTLCDQRNAEVAIAGKIAARCGLRHEIIERPPDWYGRMVDEACWESAGLWCWNESHFLPLCWPEMGFSHDVAMLGFAADTLFKGAYLGWPKLWQGWDGRRGPEPSESEFVELVLHAPQNFNAWLRPVLQPAFVREAEEAVREVIAERYRRIRRWASFTPDLWELYSFDSQYRNNSFANLACLRRATSERNLLSSPRVFRLYQTIPCVMRTADASEIVPQCLAIVGKRLSWLPDSNSWLPVKFPHWTHDAAIWARIHVAARIRSTLLSLAGSRSISGHCGWTRFDRLLRIDPTIHDVMQRLVDDEAALPDWIFDRAAVKGLWQRHLEGSANHADQLYLLASFGVFFRQITMLMTPGHETASGR